MCTCSTYCVQFRLEKSGRKIGDFFLPGEWWPCFKFCFSFVSVSFQLHGQFIYMHCWKVATACARATGDFCTATECWSTSHPETRPSRLRWSPSVSWREWPWGTPPANTWRRWVAMGWCRRETGTSEKTNCSWSKTVSLRWCLPPTTAKWRPSDKVQHYEPIS